MTELEKLKQELYHDTRLVLQRLNRKLEKYGSVEVESPMFEPNTVKTRISMYKEMEKQVYMILKDMYIPEGEWNPVRNAPNNTLYFSLSKDSIERLSEYYDRLNALNESVPTWSEYLKSITRSDLNLLKKSDRQEALMTLDLLETRDYFVSLQEILENSSSLIPDDTLQELLIPFRNEGKGGTRNGRRTVTEEEYQKLKQYAHDLQNELALQRKSVTPYYSSVDVNAVQSKIKNGGIFKKRKR